MITIEQAQVIGTVWRKFNANESLKWTDFDDFMEHLAYLDDLQIYHETKSMVSKHHAGNARCAKNHDQSECFVPIILEASEYIVDDFKETGRFAKKARYVLEYYLSISQTGFIISD